MSITEVYKHLDVQLKEVLERDRTCAELARQVLIYSRNLIADAIAYLLVGPTDLKKTDDLPSLEAVNLWKALPSESHPLPGRVDPKMQKALKDVWTTDCGELIAGLLRSRWCVHLFEGAEEAATAQCGTSTDDMTALIAHFKDVWAGTSLKGSGLAGSFRKAEEVSKGVRMDYLAAVELLMDLAYLIGEALVQFHRISDGLGDYGMIQVADWLHPFLHALGQKVLKLKTKLESLNKAVDDCLVVKKWSGYAVEKPTPSERMGQRASMAIERAVNQSSNHAQLLLERIEELRQKSSKDRLPEVKAKLCDACKQLDAVFKSSQFRACVGDSFPTDLPQLSDEALGPSRPQIADAPRQPGASRLQIADLPSQVEISEVADAEGDSNFGSECSLRTAGTADCRGALGNLETGRSPRTAAPKQKVARQSLGKLPPFPPESTKPSALEQCKNEVSPGNPFAVQECGVSPRNPFAVQEDQHGVSAGNPFDLQEGQDGVSPENPFALEDGHYTASPGNPFALQEGASTGNAFEVNQRTGGLSTFEKELQLIHDSSSLCASVTRLSTSYCGPGFRRHDRRGLRLEDGQLDIFDKGSALNVKSEIVVNTDVDECVLFAGNRRLSLIFRRAQAAEVGVAKNKSYVFEFDTADEALAFHSEINRLLNS
jgi:hypothetical protein